MSERPIDAVAEARSLGLRLAEAEHNTATFCGENERLRAELEFVRADEKRYRDWVLKAETELEQVRARVAELEAWISTEGRRGALRGGEEAK